MAKYLDQAGLQKLWTAIKSYAKNNGPEGSAVIAALNGDVVSLYNVKEENGKIGQGTKVTDLAAIAHSGLAKDVKTSKAISGIAAGTNLEDAIASLETSISKDKYVQKGSIVKGTWGGSDGLTFTPADNGGDVALKLELENQDTPIYIKVSELVNTGATATEGFYKFTVNNGMVSGVTGVTLDDLKKLANITPSATVSKTATASDVTVKVAGTDAFGKAITEGSVALGAASTTAAGVMTSAQVNSLNTAASKAGSALQTVTPTEKTGDNYVVSVVKDGTDVEVTRGTLPTSLPTSDKFSVIVADTAAKVATAAATKDPFVNFIKNEAVGSHFQIKGGKDIAVSSDASGVITVASTYTPDTHTLSGASNKISLGGTHASGDITVAGSGGASATVASNTLTVSVKGAGQAQGSNVSGEDANSKAKVDVAAANGTITVTTNATADGAIDIPETVIDADTFESWVNPQTQA